MTENLIVIKQLPQIEEHLKDLSSEIDVKVNNAKKLVCTEETVKTVKQVRADLTKDFKNLEEQRKTVKEQILAPYMQFEEVYKTYVSNKYKEADIDLKQKIDSTENELKKQKEQEIKLQELDKETQSKQKDQQTLWEEECRKSQLSEQMIEWIESENFHTGQEILQELDSQLKKVEGILKQYILTEKKNMENIMQIIDDPGR